jgi:hypothetical protein
MGIACNIYKNYGLTRRSQWPRARSTAARLLRLWVLIPPEAWMFVCCVCMCCQRSLRRVYHSSRGVQPNLVRRCV